MESDTDNRQQSRYNDEGDPSSSHGELLGVRRSEIVHRCDQQSSATYACQPEGRLNPAVSIVETEPIPSAPPVTPRERWYR